MASYAVGSSEKWSYYLSQSLHSFSGFASTCLFKSLPVHFDWKWRCLLSSIGRCFSQPWFVCIFLAGVCSAYWLWILKWSRTRQGRVRYLWSDCNCAVCFDWRDQPGELGCSFFLSPLPKLCVALYRISFQADSKPSGVNDCRQPKFSLRFTVVDSELLINGHF